MKRIIGPIYILEYGEYPHERIGVGLLSRLISRMRNEGYVIKSQACTYAAVIVRINEFAHITPPSNLPVREITFTEYWISR